MVDKDGKFVYSNIVSVNVNIKGNSVTAVYPSPFVDKINISLVNETAGKLGVQLFDNTGKLVNKQMFTVNKGINNIIITGLDKIAKGFYIIKVTLGENVFVQNS